MKQFIRDGLGEKCPKCFKEMEHRKRTQRPPKEKLYYFTEYDYCKPCGHMQHYEKYKCQNWQELESQEEHMRSIKNETLF